MNTFGNVTPPAIWLTSEAHKLMREFPVSAEVFSGCPVKINPDGSGILPLAAGDADYLRIGYSIHNRKPTSDFNQPYGTSPTAVVVMRGYATLQVLSGAAIVPGPCKFNGLVTNPNYVAPPTNGGQGNKTVPAQIARYINIVTTGGSPDTNCDAWCLSTAGAANAVIEVIVR